MQFRILNLSFGRNFLIYKYMTSGDFAAKHFYTNMSRNRVNPQKCRATTPIP